MFRLPRQRAANCGVYCGEDGLYLGSAALIERDEHRGYRIRTAAEIEALLAAAYETPPDLAGCLAGLDNVSADLLAGHVALAQIRALQLRLFEIPEDRLDLLARADRLLKANFDPAEPRDRHGRWTDDDNDGAGGEGGGEGGSGGVMDPTNAGGSGPAISAARKNFPNADFRNRLAVAEGTAEHKISVTATCTTAPTPTV